VGRPGGGSRGIRWGPARGFRERIHGASGDAGGQEPKRLSVTKGRLDSRDLARLRWTLAIIAVEAAAFVWFDGQTRAPRHGPTADSCASAERSTIARVVAVTITNAPDDERDDLCFEGAEARTRHSRDRGPFSFGRTGMTTPSRRRVIIVMVELFEQDGVGGAYGDDLKTGERVVIRGPLALMAEVNRLIEETGQPVVLEHVPARAIVETGPPGRDLDFVTSEHPETPASTLLRDGHAVLSWPDGDSG